MSVEGSYQPDLETQAAAHRALGDATRLAIVDAIALGDRTPGDLTRHLGVAANLLAHHVDVLEAAGLVLRTVSEADRRKRYVSLLPAATPNTATLVMDVTNVLFVCTHNSARSKLAEAMWTRHSAIPVGSAGMAPALRIHPLARKVAERHELPLPATAPRSYRNVTDIPSLVVSVCDRAAEAPLPWPARRIHWSIPDPAPGEASDFERAFRMLEPRVTRLAQAVTRPEEQS